VWLHRYAVVAQPHDGRAAETVANVAAGMINSGLPAAKTRTSPDVPVRYADPNF
jgi:hypothetical protein